MKGVTTVTTYEERHDRRFHEVTIATLNDIEQRLDTIEPSDDLLQSSLRYAAAYGILRVYVESVLVNFAEAFSDDQLADIKIVLDQLRKLVREDEHLDEATREKLDQLAQALRESNEDFHSPEHDPLRDYVAEMHDGDQEQQGKQEYTLYWHPSEMYTERLAYGDDRPLWGSERLEVFHDGRWVDGKVGHVGAASGLVLWPRENAGNPEYIVLTIGSLVRNVSEPVGDGTGPEE
jgi:hypothetical protein